MITVRANRSKSRQSGCRHLNTACAKPSSAACSTATASTATTAGPAANDRATGKYHRNTASCASANTLGA